MQGIFGLSPGLHPYWQANLVLMQAFLQAPTCSTSLLVATKARMVKIKRANNLFIFLLIFLFKILFIISGFIVFRI